MVIRSKFVLRWQWCVTCSSTEVGMNDERDLIPFGGKTGLTLFDFVSVFSILRGRDVV